jgi:alanine dehydrogenase
MGKSENKSLASGLNILAGRIVYPTVTETFGLPYEPITK